MPYNTIIVSGGGGSTAILNKMRAFYASPIHKRPDIAFDPIDGEEVTREINKHLKLSDYPTKEHQAIFSERTFGWYELNRKKTTEENMIAYLLRINESNKAALLSGSISRIGQFFTKNKTENTLLLVRHPLHQMASLMVNRHPEKQDRYGGLNTSAAVEYYAKLWNDIVRDALLGGLKIIRYEYVESDLKGIKDKNIVQLFKGWNSSRRNYDELTQRFEDYLKKLTSDIFFKLYKKWEI